MKRVVVTGATSFIGVHVIERFAGEGVFVYAITRPHSENRYRLPENRLICPIEMDMDEIEKLPDKIFEPIDGFIHLAWEGTRGPDRNDKKLQERNLAGTIEAMRVAVKLQAPCFIGSGSQAEYGLCSGKVDEAYPCRPVTEYGKAKYQASMELAKMAQISGIRFVWPRIFSVYGKYDYSQTLIMSCVDKMLHSETVKTTACIQMWDYVYVEDVASAFIKFWENSHANGIYNIASGQVRILREYVEEIKRIIGSDSQIEYGAVPYGKEGPVNLAPSVEKIYTELGWKADTPFETGIQKLIQEYRPD